jgi:hypothetical protein
VKLDFDALNRHFTGGSAANCPHQIEFFTPAWPSAFPK